MHKIRPTPKTLAIGLGALILIGGVIFAVILLRQITPEKAQAASQKHFDDVKAKITTIPGYKIIKEGRPRTTSVQDEMGADDYTLSANFLLQKLPAGSTKESIEADIATFTRQLPPNEYGILVENTPPTDTQPLLLCVYASRYLNNDGSYIPQGSAENIGKYIPKEQFEVSSEQPTHKNYTSHCADLLP